MPRREDACNQRPPRRLPIQTTRTEGSRPKPLMALVQGSPIDPRNSPQETATTAPQQCRLRRIRLLVSEPPSDNGIYFAGRHARIWHDLFLPIKHWKSSRLVAAGLAVLLGAAAAGISFVALLMYMIMSRPWHGGSGPGLFDTLLVAMPPLMGWLGAAAGVYLAKRARIEAEREPMEQRIAGSERSSYGGSLTALAAALATALLVGGLASFFISEILPEFLGPRGLRFLAESGWAASRCSSSAGCLEFQRGSLWRKRS